MGLYSKIFAGTWLWTRWEEPFQQSWLPWAIFYTCEKEEHSHPQVFLSNPRVGEDASMVIWLHKNSGTYYSTASFCFLGSSLKWDIALTVISASVCRFVESNQLTGPIPSELSGMTKLLIGYVHDRALQRTHLIPAPRFHLWAVVLQTRCKYPNCIETMSVSVTCEVQCVFSSWNWKSPCNVYLLSC